MMSPITVMAAVELTWKRLVFLKIPLVFLGTSFWNNFGCSIKMERLDRFSVSRITIDAVPAFTVSTRGVIGPGTGAT